MGCCGCIGKLCKYSTLLVALLAVLIGTGTFTSLGVWRYVDTNFPFAKGMVPVFHHGTPFGFTLDDIPKAGLKGQIVVVTGANVGLGYWTAHHIAGKGAHVVLACRTQKKCKEAVVDIRKEHPHVSVETATLDLNSFASVKSFADSFSKKHQKLNSLILNAGIMLPPFTLTQDGLESQIGVNHFGHFLLTKLLLPVLKKTATPSHPATIVSVASCAAWQTYPEGVKLSLAEMNDEAAYDAGKAYGQSKLANILFAQELAGRVEKDNILVNSIHPGGVDTSLARHVKDKAVAVLDKISPELSKFYIDYVFDPLFEAACWNPSVASYTQIYTAVGPKLLREKITGQYYHPIARQHTPPEHAANPVLQKGLWELSEEVVADKLDSL